VIGRGDILDPDRTAGKGGISTQSRGKIGGSSISVSWFLQFSPGLDVSGLNKEEGIRIAKAGTLYRPHIDAVSCWTLYETLGGF